VFCFYSARRHSGGERLGEHGKVAPHDPPAALARSALDLGVGAVGQSIRQNDRSRRARREGQQSAEHQSPQRTADVPRVNADREADVDV